MAQRLRVGVVGAGYFAQFHLDAWRRLQAEGQIELLGLAEPDAQRRTEAQQTFGLAAVFADAAQMLQALRPEVLDIATPPHTHMALLRLAAEHDVHCISQKPLAPTLAEARAMVDLAERAGVRLAVHENFRWMPWYREMKNCLDRGLLGQLHGVSVRMRPGDGQGPQAYLARQPYFQTMPRFWVHETAVHFIDTFRFLCGEVSSVSALLRRLNPAIAGEDAGLITLGFANGATALIDGNRLNDHPADNTRLTMGEHWLEGSHGVLRLDGFGQLHWKPHGQVEQAHPYSWRNQGFAGDCVYAQQKHLVEAFAQGQPLVNSGRDYLRNLEIEEAVYQANAEGRRILLSAAACAATFP